MSKKETLSLTVGGRESGESILIYYSTHKRKSNYLIALTIQCEESIISSTKA